MVQEVGVAPRLRFSECAPRAVGAAGLRTPFEWHGLRLWLSTLVHTGNHLVGGVLRPWIPGPHTPEILIHLVQGETGKCYF